MDGEQQPHLRVIGRYEPGLHVNHRLLHDVGGGALQRGVFGHALGVGTHREVAVGQIGQRPEATEQRTRPAIASGMRHQIVHELLHPAIAREVLADVLLGDAALDR